MWNGTEHNWNAKWKEMEYARIVKRCEMGCNKVEMEINRV